MSALLTIERNFLSRALKFDEDSLQYVNFGDFSVKIAANWYEMWEDLSIDCHG